MMIRSALSALALLFALGTAPAAQAQNVLDPSTIGNADADNAAQAAEAAPAALASPWVEVPTANGTAYYYNTQTDEASWEKPDEGGAAGSAGLPAASLPRLNTAINVLGKEAEADEL